MNKPRYVMFIVAIFIAFALSALGVIPALADDGTPPPTEPSPIVDPPPVDGAETGEPPTSENMEVLPPVENVAQEITLEVVISEAEETDILLDQIPEGMELVVVNAEGEVVSLASQEAAEIVNLNDPIWCPTGVAPNPGVGGCTTSQSSFNGGLLSLISNKGVSGTIWILGSYTGTLGLEGGAVTIDGSLLGTTANFALTIQGGWTGASSGTLVDTSNPSEFNVPLSIIGWNADVTLNDLLITAVTGPSSTALTVTTTKNITMNRVNVSDNDGDGADLYNAGGNGNVTINSSHFDYNAGTGIGGISAYTTGLITLNTLTAIGNGAFGAYFSNTAAPVLAPKAVILGGVNNFSNNFSTGLKIYSDGAITVNNVTASANGQLGDPSNGWGATLSNTSATTAQPITLTGTNVFEYNSGTGLGVWSDGVITVANLQGNNSANWIGVYLQNDSATTPQAVNLTGTGGFNDNNWTGLVIYSKGAITLNNISAFGNGTDGVYLNNQIALGVGGVTVNGFNGFANNGETGIRVYSNGSITLANLDAYDNAIDGVYLNNDVVGSTGGISVGTVAPNWINYLGGNGDNGIEVYSRGAITLLNVEASNNGYTGAYLSNSTAVSAMSVTITNSMFEYNGWVNDDLVSQLGLEVYSKGAITISNLDANYNGNGDLDPNDGGTWLDNTAGMAGVTLLGVNMVSSNEWGLGIFTNGAVVLNNLVNNSNYNGSGLYVDNCGWDGSACTSEIVAPISILGTNEFKFNRRGIHMTTNGAIILNNITASNNFGNCQQCGGIYLWNANSSTSAGVTLTGVNTFRENSMTGLQIYSKGVVTLSNITANDNGWYDSDTLSVTYDQYFGNGAYIDNTFAITPKSVVLTGLNSFMGNATTGLMIFSKGSIAASSVNASWNGWADGSDIDPSDSSHGDGAYLDNCLINDAGTPLDDTDDYCGNPVLTSPITLTGTNNFMGNNWGGGLIVETLSTITVNNITANDNGWVGVNLDNNWTYWSAATSSFKFPYSGVTILGYANANNNGYRGVGIYSTGIISVANVNANNNGNMGLRIFNAADSSQPKAVSLFGVNTFNGNWMDGLNITSYGAVTTNNISAQGNGHYDGLTDTYFGYGTKINNCGWDGSACYISSPASAVLINGTNNFSDNTLSGLEVYSKGAITVSGLSASWNGWVDQNNEDYWDHDNDVLTPDVPNTNTVYGYGAFLYNRDGLAPVTINGTNTYFESNWNSGLHVESRGAITVNNLTSRWNGQENGLKNNADPFDANDANGAYLDNWWTGAVGGISIIGYSKTNGNEEYGLEIYSKGIILLANVTSNNNSFKGVHLENSALASAPMAVTLTGTNNFTGNGAHGLVIKSYGAITLSNVNANWNGGTFNAYIDNCRYGTTGCTALVQSAITLTGTNSFDGNWGGGGGLYMESFGNITMSNLSASNNNDSGAYIDNQWFNQADIPVASLGNLTITGYGYFDGNGSEGLVALSNGNITIANLDANNNGGNGYTGGAYLSAEKPGAGVGNVVLTGFNNLNQNYGGTGLTVFADGAITIANLSANENWNGSGAYLNNRNTNTIPMAVTLTGFNNFWHNYMDGLTIYSYGAVTVNSVDASSNGVDESWSNPAGPEYGWGLYIENRNPITASAKAVTLTGTNVFNGNWNSGLEIWSSNLVTLSNITARWNGNYYDEFYSYAGADGTYVGCGDQTIDIGAGDFYIGCGAYINNTSTATPLGVTLNGFNNFSGNTHDGLIVFTAGQIALSNLESNNNGWYADWADTTPDTVFGNGAYLISLMKGVVLTGTNTFDGNWDHGLFVQALDPIVVNNLEANNNGAGGAYLDNMWDVKHSNVTVVGYSDTHGNNGDGLMIYTNGSVTLANINTTSNNGNGLYIEAYDNNPAPLGMPSNVTISGTSWFWGNSYDGLWVLADGVISLNNINASHNGGNGATLDNISMGYWTPLPSVRLTITGINNFNGNGNMGLDFISFGNVTLSRITADNNGGTGVNGSTTGNITFTCGSTTRNSGSGYDLSASGSLTLSGVYSFGNFLYDVRNYSTLVRNRTCPLP